MLIQLAVVAVTLLVGCTSSAQIGASPSSSLDATPQPERTRQAPIITPGPTPTARPIHTDHPPTTPRSTPTPSPSAPSLGFVDGLEASDEFWNRWYDDCFFGAFSVPESVDAIIAVSDLVIRGTIADLSTASFLGGGFRRVHLKVSIGELLKRQPVTDDAGLITVEIGYGSDLDRLRASLPAHDHLWFLIKDGLIDGRYYAYEFVQVSVLREIDGVVEVIRPNWIAQELGRGHYPGPLDGTSFEKLMKQVRELTATSGITNSSARISRPPERGPVRFAAC